MQKGVQTDTSEMYLIKWLVFCVSLSILSCLWMRSLCLLHISLPPLVFGLFTFGLCDLGLDHRLQLLPFCYIIICHMTCCWALYTTHHHIPAYINSRNKCLMLTLLLQYLHGCLIYLNIPKTVYPTNKFNCEVTVLSENKPKVYIFIFE